MGWVVVHAIARGSVGHGDGGQLTERIGLYADERIVAQVSVVVGVIKIYVCWW